MFAFEANFAEGAELGAAFALLRRGAELGLLTGAFALVLIAVGAARHSRGRLGLTIVALVIALTAFGVPWRMQAHARRVPSIHDITTDPEDPPVFVAVVPHRAGARNPVTYAGAAVALQQRAGYPDIVPLDLPVPPDRVFPTVESVEFRLDGQPVTTFSSEGIVLDGPQTRADYEDVTPAILVETPAPFETVTDPGVFEKLMQVNYLGAVYCIHAALPHLLHSRGLIVAISSAQAWTGMPMHTGYAAAKAALQGFLDSLEMEMDGRVRVLGVYPGWIRDTELRRHALGADGHELAFVS